MCANTVALKLGVSKKLQQANKEARNVLCCCFLQVNNLCTTECVCPCAARNTEQGGVGHSAWGELPASYARGAWH